MASQSRSPHNELEIPNSSQTAHTEQSAPQQENTAPQQPPEIMSNEQQQAVLEDVLSKEASESERKSLGPANIRHIAQALLKFSAQRPPRTPSLRIYNPTFQEHGWTSDHTVLEMVCDDQPFLVDSILGTLNAENMNIHVILHPVIRYARDENDQRIHLEAANGAVSPTLKAESIIHVQFQRHSDQSYLTTLEEKIQSVIKSVQTVVADFGPMRTRLYEMIGQLETSPPTTDPAKTAEALSFLHWLRDNHFVFLGCRMYRFSGTLEEGGLEPLNDTGLGLLRDPDIRVLRKASSRASMSPEVREFLALPTPIIITKSNIRSEIHRRVYMDYIGIKRFDESGALIGECRFIGLFTADAYSQSVFSVPLLAQKAQRALTASTTSPNGYNYKALRNIMERFPRDEFFQITDEELADLSTKILDLYERPRTRLFIRRDKFDRYASALLYVPRDRYTSDIRQKVGKVLVDAFDGRQSAYYPHFDDSPLARVQYIIGFDKKPDPEKSDEQRLEEKVIEVTENWGDAFQSRLLDSRSEEVAHRQYASFQRAFTASYQEKNTPQEAVSDVDMLLKLEPFPGICVRTYVEDGLASTNLKFKIYQTETSIALSDILPILEHMGFRVLHESGFLVHTPDTNYWIHDFEMESSADADLRSPALHTLIEDTFLAVWQARSENDAYNQLVPALGLGWRYAVLFRAFSGYQRQIGQALSKDYIVATLIKYKDLTKTLIDLFDTRFNPANADSAEARKARQEALQNQIIEQLEQVESLDEDRIFRRLLNLIQSIWRTNYFQTQDDGAPKSYISFKINSADIEQMPTPRPFAEIYVFSPRIEGIHLRWGKVARGGLRWSDRREDYRTEILGLVKAQKVKNAVIVPVGAKGGFVARQLDRKITPDEKRDEGIASYRIFISGLLDLTDNFIDGTIIPPKDIVRHDDDDPYLVVAADKGTATFSDIANDMSAHYNFWLGDAFASGGSNGYDHKKMGITARGAWEAVKRHFRESGTDIQTEPFTAAGVGDMSGDVFGNGMLLSQQTKLVAAFDHRHIFIDPSPDAELSFHERKRLFEKPRSSWDDYNRDLISQGGSVFPRSAKSVELTAEIKDLLNLDVDRLTTAELIQAILSAQVDLLWFGGIGTYIKAEGEHDSEVGDRANDLIRVTADQVCAKVVGEGANLGLTQKGRIDLAHKGCRLNTDAIDNSAGVDCSDHEVNIKILLANAVSTGILSTDNRNALLEAMTEEVSDLVLTNNYAQTLTLSLAEKSAAEDLNAHKRLIHALEADKFLDRRVEGLPNDDVLSEMETANQGLTRPELAVLLAYAKLRLFEDLTHTDFCVTDDFDTELKNYFPHRLRKEYNTEIENHQLRKQIAATILANDTINDGGIVFVNRLIEHTGKAPEQIVAGKVSADRIFELDALRQQINELDNKVPASVQLQLHQKTVAFLRRQVLWFVRDTHQYNEQLISETVKLFKPHIDLIKSALQDHLPPRSRDAFENEKARLIDQDIPENLAHAIASLDFLVLGCDICELTEKDGLDPLLTASIYFSLGEELHIDVLRAQAISLRGLEHWDRLALRRALEDFDSLQSVLADSALRLAPSGSADLISLWLTSYNDQVSRFQKLLESIETSGPWSVSKLSLAAGELRQLALAIERQS